MLIGVFAKALLFVRVTTVDPGRYTLIRLTHDVNAFATILVHAGSDIADKLLHDINVLFWITATEGIYTLVRALHL